MTCTHNWMLCISEVRGICVECGKEQVGHTKPDECEHYWIEITCNTDQQRKHTCYFCDTVKLEDFEDEPYWN